MELKTYINGTEYDIVNGASYAEEYNETLDSATIIIDCVPKIDKILPYDDVFIYNNVGTFAGYTSSNTKIVGIDVETIANPIRLKFSEDIEIIRNGIVSQSAKAVSIVSGSKYPSTATFRYYNSNIQISVDSGPYQNLTKSGNYYYVDCSSLLVDDIVFEYVEFEVANEDIAKPTFYRHFLIDQYSEQRLSPDKNLYKYTIQLFSETKGLETIQLPNKSITQPFNIAKKKSVAQCIREIVDLYSPNKKVAINGSRWVYRKKYSVSSDIDTKFGDVYSPDFQLDNPSLRDVLNQLMLTKDCIAVVHDDVISYYDITQRNGTFVADNVTSIVSSMSSDNYANNLKRTYSNALSDNSSTRRVEYLGFRNSTNALLTLGNMRVETQYGIHKINRILMCYYKMAKVYERDGNDEEQWTGETKVFLCKQDITPLVMLEEQRQALTEDWDDFEQNQPSGANVIEEMARYRMCTLGYSVGGKEISGWGTKYTYPKGWWDVSKTYIENIFNIIDKNKPYGIYDYGFIANEFSGTNKFLMVQQIEDPLELIITNFGNASVQALKLKSFFFEVDYDGFYNGTIIHSKDSASDDVTINDNSNSSLVLLEKDGLFQKEKINRFGNPAVVISATYSDLSGLQALGSVYDDDIIIYHREYQIWHNMVKAVYYGTKDYVLKNYFTSVYAKNRPFALAGYSQSVLRSENRKLNLLLSKDNQYFEQFGNEFNESVFFNFENFSGRSFIELLAGFFTPSEQATSIGRFVSNDIINSGTLSSDGTNIYKADINEFVSGYSLCMSVEMVDNISMGMYIKVTNPEFNSILSPTEDDYTGSVQRLYPIIDDSDTGEIDELTFAFAHNEKEKFSDYVIDYYANVANDLYNKINALPKITQQYTKNIIKSKEKIIKDNKEVINMTFQFEPYTDDSDIVFSSWLMKLSDLNGKYLKIDKAYSASSSNGYGLEFDVRCATGISVLLGVVRCYPTLIFKIPINQISNIAVNSPARVTFDWDKSLMGLLSTNKFIGFSVNAYNVVSINSDELVLRANVVKRFASNKISETKEIPDDVELHFHRVNQVFGNDYSNDADNYYYSNIEMTDYSTMGVYFDNFSDSGMIYGEMTSSLLNNEISYNGIFSEQNSYDTKMLTTTAAISQTYYKNMFLEYSIDEIGKELVYNEYAESTSSIPNETEKVSNVFSIVDEVDSTEQLDGQKYIKVDLSNLSSEQVKSIRVWYCDRKDHTQIGTGILHFVFGLNLSSEDYIRGYAKISLSLLSKKSVDVYGANNLVVGKNNNFLSSENDKTYGNGQYYVVE